ncbi:MAG TPA: transketolase [Myxococcaceae bacterium]|nr:transketolase [Myxococcaceae bacterium]
MSTPGIAQLAINTLRTLSIDAVQKANSGHPGAPMGFAPVAYALWHDVLRYDPADPLWPNRDRFVLSNGHASMLLYSTLFLAGVREVDRNGKVGPGRAVSLEDIQAFRQLGSRTPGHPEYGLTTGVEATTGPLGQGAGNSVGMAIASRWLGTRYNRPGRSLFDFDVYAFVGDGCLMEGISAEAASLAGHLRLSNLCWVYDNNHVSLDGKTALSFSEDAAARFASQGWAVIRVDDANDLAKLGRAFAFFRESDRPTLIIVDSHIGYGSPKKQDTSAAHGEPLGADEVKAAKRNYGWPEDAQFLVPDGVREDFAGSLGVRGRTAREAWQRTWEAYRTEQPGLADEVERIRRRELPEGWEAALVAFPPDPKGLATRESSGRVLEALGQRIPWIVGGAADLSVSTKTSFKGEGPMEVDHPAARNVYYGVREHAMGAVVNGMVLSGLRGYGATFFTFTDYMRTPIRLSALMEIPSLWVMTHDSIGLGEDGPTHQPIEQLAALRAVPHLLVFRPADANEVIECWRVALQSRHRPSLLVLSRQAVPTFDRRQLAPASGAARGAYVLADAEGGRPDVLLLATGSEVMFAVAARELLAADGIRARVVSMPCWRLFEEQEAAYRESVLPASVTARVSVEAGATLGWDRYVGRGGTILGMHGFGASAPLQAVQKHFGFTAENVAAAARALVRGGRKG